MEENYDNYIFSRTDFGVCTRRASHRRSSAGSSGSDDLGLTNGEIGVVGVSLDEPTIAFQRAASSDGQEFYYSDQGFVASVSRSGDTLYVVFRGTDSAESFTQGIAKAGFSLNPKIVRDNLIRTGVATGNSPVNAKALTPFELENLSNGVGVDISDITPNDSQIYGLDELNNAFSLVAGLNSPDIQAAFNANMIKEWTVAIVQSGTEAMRYSMSAVGLAEGSLAGNSGHMIFGGDKDDRLRIPGGVDHIFGGKGDDIIEGGAGADYLIGGDQGAKGDTVSYSTSIQSIDINPSISTAQSGGDAEGDYLSGFENVRGSAQADVFRGGENQDKFFGEGGDDTYYAYGDGLMSTADTFDGGADFDRLNVSSLANLGNVVDQFGRGYNYIATLGNGGIVGYDGFGLLLYSVENYTGSSFNDKIVASADINFPPSAKTGRFIYTVPSESDVFSMRKQRQIPVDALWILLRPVNARTDKDRQ